MVDSRPSLRVGSYGLFAPLVLESQSCFSIRSRVEHSVAVQFLEMSFCDPRNFTYCLAVAVIFGTGDMALDTTVACVPALRPVPAPFEALQRCSATTLW